MAIRKNELETKIGVLDLKAIAEHEKEIDSRLRAHAELGAVGPLRYGFYRSDRTETIAEVSRRYRAAGWTVIEYGCEIEIS